MTRYRTLLLTLILAAALPSFVHAQDDAEASRVRILLVIDDNAPDTAGAAFDLDLRSLKPALEKALHEQGLDDRYTLDVLQRAAATRANVLAYYAKLRVRPSEALLFYASGHGVTHPTQGHQ